MKSGGQAIKETNYTFKGQTGFYRGKVRDVYRFGDLLVMVATDRISAFDVVLPEPIAHKGRVLNQIAAIALRASADIVDNWLVDTPDPNVSVGRACDALPVEMVVRGYLAGHAWREYQAGRRQICGVKLPEGLSENDRLPTPIITPTTKAAHGHDEDISAAQIIQTGLVSSTYYEQMQAYSLALFGRGTELAAQRGLILVDTKYEFGLYQDKIILIDEMHTPDSSRYFYASGYAERQAQGQPQKQLSKEFVRKWLIENNFQGLDGQQIPLMDQAILDHISGRYLELFEQMTGLVLAENLNKNEEILMETRIKSNIELYLKNHL